MIKNLWNKFKKKEVDNKIEKKPRPRQIMSTDDFYLNNVEHKINVALERNFQNSIHPQLKNAFDSSNASFASSFAQDNYSIKSSFYGNEVIPQGQMLWFANQTFIGYQLCAMLAQQWLISKCCWMPADDATRKGYDITINDGTDIDPEILDKMRKLDVQFDLNKNLIQMIGFGRMFGIRIVMFKVESDDPEYYFKPFNPDGITPGSYKGISQVDPYWITPQLDPESAGDPSSIHFYEPTWWNIAGKLVHRTHLITYRTEELADILKPTYIYGGVPIPQKIYERVYAAERTANEAPMLALTKRLDVLSTDMTKMISQEQSSTSRLQFFTQMRDNYGVKVINKEDEIFQQFDTSLADLDAVIMTQYQLVAAAANVPAVKLLGTSPKGFNTTGEYEEANYHEMLESLQTHALTPLIERHHMLLIRSHICPEFGIKPFNTTVTWKPLDAMTAKELAELNRMKAETGAILSNVGAIDGVDERERIISDPDSGYIGLNNENPITEEPAESISSDPIGGINETTAD